MIYSVSYEGTGYHGGIIEDYDNYLQAKEHFLRLKEHPRNEDDISISIEECTDDGELLHTLLEHTYAHPE